MAEPVTLAEAKLHLDVVRDDQDELIASPSLRSVAQPMNWSTTMTAAGVTSG